ncbi:DEAD/DEAH box helicase domain-containing protein [Enteractinococcus coprophilus]|uniref:DEAD/DEAH box helicase domain-containing protein n=1 Tax=Enteractinococcus coprophilus TaxID=1027633 RepID=A0A543AM50_9MICC|nr:DEAD/DEAH box helicase domain-containing protein [Enteractinococcus coprophilus]
MGDPNLRSVSPSHDHAAAYLAELLGYSRVPDQLVHTRVLPERTARFSVWPQSLPEKFRTAVGFTGVEHPFAHQVAAAELASAGEHVVLATGTASGKSLAYHMPVATTLTDGISTALYLAPTKALSADQLASWQYLADHGVNWLRPAAYDGDTDPQSRTWAREHANVLVTNPDMLHVGILPNHSAWSKFFRHLKYVIVDEAHTYRGVFGSHVAVVLTRLRRICAHLGNTELVFFGASATSSAPADSFSALIGTPARSVEEDTSGHGEVVVGFWESEFSGATGEHDAPLRRSLVATGADMLTDLAVNSIRSVAFIRSRRGAEAMAQMVKRQLAEVDPSLVGRAATYRAGLLPEERREVEEQLNNGKLLAVSTTPALELGIDIAGLDGVVVAGWPGTRASFFQQLGRAGRAGQRSIALYVAGDDPMDTYLVHHPQAVFDLAVEDNVIDPQNPHILSAHLCAAAAELPLQPDDLGVFGDADHVRDIVEELTTAGYLRRRPAGWYWTHEQHAAGMISLRDAGGGPMQIIDGETGAILGSIGAEQAHSQTHPGAVYMHQGRTWVVEDLDEEHSTVVVLRAEPEYYTQARDVTDVEILGEDARLYSEPDDLAWVHGPVKVTNQVVSYQRKEVSSGKAIDEQPLDLPARELYTQGVWFTAPSEQFIAAGLTTDRLPGALHAAEHAMIGMMPLVASNDRWDIGGVSLVLHPDTEAPTVFVYDGHPGGVGFATRGFSQASTWITATMHAIEDCACTDGCPSCVQSPKCGNRNSPLDKPGAIVVLKYVAEALTRAVSVPPETQP